MYAEKFIQPYISYLISNFDITDHFFIIRKDKRYPIKENGKILFLKNGENKISRIFQYIKHLNNAEKVIIHGILNNEMWLILFFQPWLLRRCYWVIWGGDLYSYLHRSSGVKHFFYERMMKAVISRIGFLLTFLKDDYNLARIRYGAKGKYIECLMYPSIMAKKIYSINNYNGKTINILLGNSAFHTNNHKYLIDKLAAYSDREIKIYCPLSYGPKDYAEQIENYGKKIFKKKFIAIKKNLPLNQYLSLLNKIDIALFDHKRQQALGNSISLAQRGAKIYMDCETSQFKLFKKLNITVYSNKYINISRLPRNLKNKNRNNVENFFSINNLTLQWERIFNAEI
jgi:dTDP-N-acetylfucosamine:lipid II N-acetylfucosaminyltransferase